MQTTPVHRVIYGWNFSGVSSELSVYSGIQTTKSFDSFTKILEKDLILDT